MQIITNLSTPLSVEVAATIGFFDGVHRGHAFLLNQLRQAADCRGLRSMVITFAQHPRQVLHADFRPHLLSTLDEKLQLLEECGVDYCVLLPFSREFAAQTAQQFMISCLSRVLRVKTLLIGYDHHFGSDRTEGFHQYVAYGREAGIEVVRAQAYTQSELTVSSSAVRRFLEAGNVEMAAVCLGRPYVLSGEVVRGHRVGRELGFPTANVRCDVAEKMIPADGVYAVRVEDGKKEYEGMLNIGCRPTVNNGIDRSVEVHLLDFDGDLYGRTLQIRFEKRMRNEQSFPSLEALSEQLQQDKQHVREFFKGIEKVER